MVEKSKSHLRVEFTNGAVWGIPLATVADNRATYYAEKDKDTTYQEEYDYVMSDDYEGLDWFLNNMNWVDVMMDAYEIKPPRTFDPGRELDEAECSVVLK